MTRRFSVDSNSIVPCPLDEKLMGANNLFAFRFYVLTFGQKHTRSSWDLNANIGRPELKVRWMFASMLARKICPCGPIGRPELKVYWIFAFNAGKKNLAHVGKSCKSM